jgi:urate oxidase
MGDDASRRRATSDRVGVSDRLGGAAGLAAHGYGKDGIRILTRGYQGDGVVIRDLTLDLRISGDFSPAYLRGDNSTTLPTDAMRNHAYAVALERPAAEPEDLAAEILERLLRAIPAATAGWASLTIHPWVPLPPPGASAFVPAGWAGQAEVGMDRSGTTTMGGLIGLSLLSPFGSNFVGFHRDEMTDQPDAVNRVLAGTVAATWHYRSAVESFTAARDRARAAIIEAFRVDESPAIQWIVFAMGAAALSAVPELDDITVTFAGRPHAPASLPGGRDPTDAVWSVAEGPCGITEATVRRS